MLKTIAFLRKHGLEKLKTKYSIKTNEHEDGRILLNYDQIESPKTAEIVRECRGLCLNKNDFSLISRSFRRFFNAGEWRADDNKFDWSNSYATSKEDGSLINFYWYNNKWQVQTRGSFGDIPFYTGGPTPEELVYGALGTRINGFDKTLSYTLELCSRHNKIVRDYPQDTIYLLSVFDGENERPFDGLYKKSYSTSNESIYTGVQTPEQFEFSSLDEVVDYIRDRSKNDKTYEGLVLRDGNNNRLKVKNPDYLCLHRMRGEGANLFMPKNLLPFILSGDTDELYTYFSEVRPKVEEMRVLMDSVYKELEMVWNGLKDLKTRKEFALSIPKDLKLKSILFTMLDSGKPLKDVWAESKDLILKGLF